VNKLRIYRVLFLIGISGLIISWFLIHYLSVERISGIFLEEGRKRLNILSSSFEAFLGSKAQALRFLGRSVESDPSPSSLKRLFRSFYEDHRGSILSVQWIDSGGIITEGFPTEHTPYGYNFNLGVGSSELFRRIKESKDIVISRSIVLIEGGLGFSMAYPVRRGGDFLGAVSIVISYKDSIGSLLGKIEDFILIDADTGKVVFSSAMPGILGKGLEEVFKVGLPQGSIPSYLKGELGGKDVFILFQKVSLASRSWYVSLVSHSLFLSILGFTRNILPFAVLGMFFGGLMLIFSFLYFRESIRYERRINSERSFLGRVLGSIGTPLIVLDSSGRVSFCNDYAVEVFGSDLKGKVCPFLSLYGSSCIFHKDLEEKGNLRQEFKVKDRVFDVNCALIRREVGSVEGVIVVAREVTQAKRYEVRLWDLARRLERKIWEEHILFELSKLIAINRERAKFLREAVDLIYAYFPATLVFTAFLDERWRVLKVEEVRGSKRDIKDLLLLEKGISQVVDMGETFYVPDLRGRVGIGKSFDVETLSELVIPIISKEKIIGVLFLGSDRVKAFSEEDRSILKAVADMIAIGVENAVLYERLEALATIDDLTGLYNRRYFYQKLSEEIARASRQKTGLILMFMDLDNFKVYNDTFGHLAGDKLLSVFGKILRDNLRKGTDYAFRYGGDEFAVILTSSSIEGASKVAERIAREFEHYEFEIVGVSFGIAEYEEGINEDRLVALADMALYEAKRSGGRTTIIYGRSTGLSSSTSETSAYSPDSTASA